METNNNGMNPTRRNYASDRILDDDSALDGAPSQIDIDLAINILSRIDDPSYSNSFAFDTHNILKHYLFPMSFPWHKPRAPLLRGLPRDIDDMPGLWFAGHDIARPFGINGGQLGYGAYDQGIYGYSKKHGNQSFKGIHSVRSENTVASPKRIDHGTVSDCPTLPCDRNVDNVNSLLPVVSGTEGGFIASARRSEDAGVIELSIMLPPPSSLQSALLRYQDYGILPQDPWLRHDHRSIHRAKSIMDADRAVTASTMPLLIRSQSKHKLTIDYPSFLSDFDESKDDAKSYCDDSRCSTNSGDAVYLQDFKRLNDKTKRVRELTALCTKKWNLSVKVERVSSRSTILSSSYKRTGVDTVSSETFYPLCCSASLPISVQNGKSVALGTSSQATESINYLGSYDCRVSSTNIYQEKEMKKDGDFRSKRVLAGRTRLIWTGLRASTSNRVSCFDLLTGHKVDSVGYKRPREITVAAKVNGSLLMKASSEQINVVRNNLLKDTMEMYQGHQRTLSAVSPPIEATDMESSICCAFKNRPPSLENRTIVDNTRMFGPENALCTLDYYSFFKQLEKRVKSARHSKNSKTHACLDANIVTFVPMKHGGSHILRQISPQIICVPLNDGSMRVCCEVSGSMQGSSLHNILLLTARGMGNVCSVCWCDSKTATVVECIECGLLVHRECCYNKGVIVDDRGSWKCSVCLVSMSSQGGRKRKRILAQVISNRKSRRASRVPSRFVHSPADDTLPVDLGFSKKSGKGRASYKCTLCPHSGGAMSIVDHVENNISEHNANGLCWTHEICRVWGRSLDLATLEDANIPQGKFTPSGSMKLSSSSFLCQTSRTCALCGVGPLHDRDGDKDDLMMSGTLDKNELKLLPGLIRCAAKGCFVTFHPMCAVLATRLRHVSASNRTERASDSCMKIRKDKDRELCHVYTLQLIELQRMEDPLCLKNSQPISKKTLLPVAFCGIHNPDREETFYGCPPGGDALSEHIKVPYSSQSEV